jgi:hypothetical protein|tara:strand:+ start:2551 stop:2799 length:249 start_codon:yes stop_codon:yes gene_type:complete
MSWKNDNITLSQKSHILRFCNKAMNRKFIPNIDKLWVELESLNKGQASEVMGLFKSFQGSKAMLKLKEFGINIILTREQINN